MRPQELNLDIRKLQRAIVDGLEDVKAHHIVVFNTEALSPLFERVIIASGTSNRQTRALASSVRETVKKRGLTVLRTEGEANGEWIIVDCGAAVAHIMQPAVRDYYHLEEIWGAKPVRLKGADSRAVADKAPTKSAGAGLAATKAAKSHEATRTGVKPAAKVGARLGVKPAPRPAAKVAGKAAGKVAAKPPARRPVAKAAPGKRATTPPPKRKSGTRAR